MSKAAADTLGWPFHLLWLQGKMAVAVAVQQDLGGGCPHNLGKREKICFCDLLLVTVLLQNKFSSCQVYCV